MIDCRETLRRFYDYLDRELPDARAREVAEHLERCSTCFSRMEFERLLARFVQREGRVEADAGALKARIRARLGELEEMPEAPEEELFTGHVDAAPIDDVPLPDPRPSGVNLGWMKMTLQRLMGRPAWSYLLAAGAVVLVALPFLRDPRPGEVPEHLLSRLVERHRARAPQVADTDPERLAAWLAGHIDYDPHLESFGRAGFLLQGVSVFGHETQLWAVSDSLPVSLFLIPAEALPAASGMEVREIAGHTFHTAVRSGYAIVMCAWRREGLICAIVGRTDPERLIRMAARIENHRVGA